MCTDTLHFRLGSRFDRGCPWWGLGSCASLYCHCFKPSCLLGVMSQSALTTSSSWASAARRRASMALEVTRRGWCQGCGRGPRRATPPPQAARSPHPVLSTGLLPSESWWEHQTNLSLNQSTQCLKAES